MNYEDSKREIAKYLQKLARVYQEIEHQQSLNQKTEQQNKEII